MELRKIIGGLAVAATMALTPMAANAVPSEVATESFTFTSTSDIFFFQELFGTAGLGGNGIEPSNGDFATVTVTNGSAGDLMVSAGTPATVNPGAGFDPEPVFSWAGDVDVAVNGNTIREFIAVGDSAVLTVTFGDLVQDLTNVDIRFTAIPLPAGFLLLLTGVGGLALVGRRRRMATTA